MIMLGGTELPHGDGNRKFVQLEVCCCKSN
jgi:hypothetical protein